MNCEKCGKDMEYHDPQDTGQEEVKQENGPVYSGNLTATASYKQNIIGCSILFDVADGVADEYKRYFLRQMGKYEPGKSYNFCIECYLDALSGIHIH